MKPPLEKERLGSLGYRRKVPPALREVLGKGEIVIPLGKSQADVLKNYGKTHRDAEDIIAKASDEARGTVRPMTARVTYKEALEAARTMGINPYRGRVSGMKIEVTLELDGYQCGVIDGTFEYLVFQLGRRISFTIRPKGSQKIDLKLDCKSSSVRQAVSEGLNAWRQG